MDNQYSKLFSPLPQSKLSLLTGPPRRAPFGKQTNKLSQLICIARLSLCKRDALWVLWRLWKQTLSPPPFPLTGEWQLLKCKLSLTNTTLRDTCFNHANKGAASGRAGAPSPCDIQMMGRCSSQKQQHQRIGEAERETEKLHCGPLSTKVLISLIFKVIKRKNPNLPKSYWITYSDVKLPPLSSKQSLLHGKGLQLCELSNV